MRKHEHENVKHMLLYVRLRRVKICTICSVGILNRNTERMQKREFFFLELLRHQSVVRHSTAKEFYRRHHSKHIGVRLQDVSEKGHLMNH